MDNFKPPSALRDVPLSNATGTGTAAPTPAPAPMTAGDPQTETDLRYIASHDHAVSDRLRARIDALTARVAELEREIEYDNRDWNHHVALAFVDPGANPPVSWKDRALAAEAQLKEAREALMCVRNNASLVRQPTTERWLRDNLTACLLAAERALKDTSHD